MASKQEDRDVVIIGAGPGGYEAAFAAASTGREVTLIDERDAPGGVCLHEGCIPSKTLLHAAELIRSADTAAQMGIHFSKPRIDIDALRQFSEEVVSKLTKGLRQRMKQHKVAYVQGRASFVDARTVAVKGGDGVEQRFGFEHAVIATGSRPRPLPVLDEEATAVFHAAGGLKLERVPSRLLVVGGGYIGLELGSVYASLGSKVTLVEVTEGLLPGVDRALVEVLQDSVEEQFEEVLLRTRVGDAKKHAQGLEVKLRHADGDESTRRFQQVLVAAGRMPNTEELGLEKASIATDRSGHVQVDEQQRTTQERIYAIGDVAGEPMLAHKASAEARVAVAAMAGEPSAFDVAAMPAVIFTDPELAWTGLTEDEARERDVDIRIAKFPWSASGRAATLGRRDGLTRLIVARRTGRVLGVQAVGPGAGELISEGSLAVEMGALAEDMAATVHPHPTLTETLKEAAERLTARGTL